MKAYSLYELNQFIRRVIALNLGDPVWIQGEIAQVSQSRGHYWIEFVQKGEAEEDIKAQASGVIWAKQGRILRKKLGKTLDSLLIEGMELKVQARVDFNERFGLKLIIEDIDSTYTLGKLALEKQAIKEKLEKEKLLGLNAQVPLPKVIKKVAIISSEKAAGYQDFKKQLAQNSYGYQYQTEFFNTAMQGGKVEKEMLIQLQAIARRKAQFDVVVILRGGGAKLDLSAFDNYLLSQTVAKFPLPVFIGIGHDIDESTLDLVASKSLKTPTAVADYLIHHNELFEVELLQYAQIIQQSVQHKISLQNIEIEREDQTLQLLVRTFFEKQNAELIYQQSLMEPFTMLPIQIGKQELREYEIILEMLDVSSLLERGFSIVKRLDGRPLDEPNKMNYLELIEIEYSKGKIIAKIEK